MAGPSPAMTNEEADSYPSGRCSKGARRDGRLRTGSAMKDEGFVDDGFIEETAWEYVGRYGSASVSVLRRLAEAAARGGDKLSAQTWRAIAEAAERILALGVGK